ncbi:hypothetical protein BKA82DRAFT_9219, partial [Pisolithus tinctorius]
MDIDSQDNSQQKGHSATKHHPENDWMQGNQKMKLLKPRKGILDSVHDKGKQRDIESNNNSEVWFFGFRMEGLELPPWPSISQPPMLPSTLSGPTPAASSPGMAYPMFLHHTPPSQESNHNPGPRMDVLLRSIQMSQATSHETVMKEIGTIHEQLGTYREPGCDSAMFWCFKYMVYCHDQVDRCQNHVPELNTKVLLDAFLRFKIPAQVPMGVRSGISCGLKYHDKAVSMSTIQEAVTATPEHSLPLSPTTDNHKNLVTPVRLSNLPQSQSHLTPTGDSAGHRVEPTAQRDIDVQPTVDMLLRLSVTSVSEVQQED